LPLHPDYKKDTGPTRGVFSSAGGRKGSTDTPYRFLIFLAMGQLDGRRKNSLISPPLFSTILHLSIIATVIHWTERTGRLLLNGIHPCRKRGTTYIQLPSNKQLNATAGVSPLLLRFLSPFRLCSNLLYPTPLHFSLLSYIPFFSPSCSEVLFCDVYV